MFDNIGEKIKTLASVISFVCAFIFFWAAIIGSTYDPIYLLFLILAVLSIVSSWPLYGFGQLVESTMSIEKMIKSGEIQNNILTYNNKVQFSEEKDNVEKDSDEDTKFK